MVVGDLQRSGMKRSRLESPGMYNRYYSIQIYKSPFPSPLSVYRSSPRQSHFMFPEVCSSLCPFVRHPLGGPGVVGDGPLRVRDTGERCERRSNSNGRVYSFMRSVGVLTVNLPESLDTIEIYRTFVDFADW